MARHEEIAECIRNQIKSFLMGSREYLYEEILIEDFNENEPLKKGIIISPLSDSEQIGTNERDDIDYVTLVTRNIHSLGQDDRKSKSDFRDNIRKIFHNKRIQCSESCYLYSRVSFGPFAIPEAWSKNNNSITAMRIFTLVRESRE